MKKSLTIFLSFVHKALELVLIKFPRILFIHYVDHILLFQSTHQYLSKYLFFMIEKLREQKLTMAPDKIQHQPFYNYLGYTITQR